LAPFIEDSLVISSTRAGVAISSHVGAAPATRGVDRSVGARALVSLGEDENGGALRLVRSRDRLLLDAPSRRSAARCNIRPSPPPSADPLFFSSPRRGRAIALLRASASGGASFALPALRDKTDSAGDNSWRRAAATRAYVSTTCSARWTPGRVPGGHCQARHSHHYKVTANQPSRSVRVSCPQRWPTGHSPVAHGRAQRRAAQRPPRRERERRADPSFADPGLPTRERIVRPLAPTTGPLLFWTDWHRRAALGRR